jgi:hypothetical protein
MRGSDLPEHEQRAWDAIVADLSGQIDLGPQFPKDEPSLPPLAADGDHPDPLADPVDLPDDGGYEPPAPPPIPRPEDAVGRFSWAALFGGPVVVIAANVLGWDRWLAGLGVVITIGGFVSLVARMKDREDDGDNGAVV